MLRVEISYRGMVLVALALLTAWALIKLGPVILLVVIALILMLGLLPYVESMVRVGVPRTAAVIVILLVIFAIVGGLFSVMVPALVSEFAAVRDNLPDSAREVEKFLGYFGIHVELQDRARSINWGELISGQAAVDYGQRVLSVTLSLITVLVMTAYLLADTPRLARFVGQFIPEESRDDANGVFVSLTRVVGGYIRGQIITSILIGVYTFTLLRILNVPNPLAFAVLAGFADIIPLVGSLIAVFPPVAAALQQSATTAAAVLIGLMLYQQFEDRFLVPRVYAKTMNLPPIIVLVAVLAGAELLGVTGVLLALPLTAAGRVGLDYLIRNRHLPIPGDEPFAPDVEPTKLPRRRPRAPGATAKPRPVTARKR